MPRIDDVTRQQRLDRIHLLLTRNARGLTEVEIADEINLERRTANNYLRELEFQGKAFKDGLYWFPLVLKESRLRSFDLSPEEAVTLYLGARLLSKQQDKRNEPAEAALLKLASVLKADAGVGAEIEQAARELAQRPVQENYQPVFRDVVRGYIYRKKVEIAYRPLNSKRPFTTIFSTYLLEPSPIGFSTYLIGHSSLVNALRAYKLERIESIRLTREDYSIPPDFPGLEILHNAWSIIMGEETLRVVLRFSPDVRMRVLETRWHPSQQSQDDPEKTGWLRWRVDVADTLDLLPWVRGWGADVEVLEPEGLRAELKLTAQDLAMQYQVSQHMQPSPHLLFWAKADKKPIDYHLLLYHMIDVGQVALTLWQTSLNNNLREQITEWLGLKNASDAGRLIAFWASLHDLGKASPAFQDHPYMPHSLHKKIRRDLAMAGFEVPQRTDSEKRARHEIISTSALKDEGALAKYSTLPDYLAELIAQIIGGHHGAWPQTERFSPAQLKPDDKGNSGWLDARQALVQDIVKVFQPPAINNFLPATLKDNIMLTLVSGIVSVADWLGSDEENFPYERNILPLESYAAHSRQHARYALLRADWKSTPAMPQLDFGHVFGFSPSEAQQQVSNALNQLALPALAIIEAPMGSGKTEAAMAVYAQWARETGDSGLYIAMPTTATSNQMHTRVADFLTTQFGKDIEPLLVHSQALLRDVPAENDAVEEEEGNRANAQAWFLPRKKSLLALFGVGTVDQALMSVLQTKHFFVRMLGLSHKVVIFDEVHAYDAYMSELFERLLIWLRQINVSVIVLSATLPDKMRQRLVHAYTENTEILPEINYPRLTFADSNGKVDAIELTPPAEKKLKFDWINRDEENIIQRLADELHNGGCAVVVCNTVTRAQRLYQTLNERKEKLCDDDNLILFHARFPMTWRDEIERDVLAKFGPGKDKSKPNPDRPSRAIVIATQVVEQSLDLDFDVMISDHAPIDLLLQRAGRFHRHIANDATRKQPYRLLIAAPEIDNDKIPQFTRRDVYDEYALLRSWIVLNKIPTRQIILPADLPTLIEQVYGDTEPTDEPKLLATLANAKEEMTKDELEMKIRARKRLIAKPDNEDLLWGDNAALEEDDPSVHETFQALTRSDRPGISVVCLHRINGQLLLEPDEQNTIFDLSQKLEKAMARELARHAVSVRHPDPALEHYFLAEPEDAQTKAILKKWRRVAALRYHRVAIFEDGSCPLKGTGYIMHLNKKDNLGLRIEKETQ